MRILAVRGENLASLAGPFELDFAAPPFEGAGLFAIVGPTGAGKSTLLDALCLPLYDKTPRLYQKGGARVGREGEAERLAEGDVRSILRRGAASGFAEVDFQSGDGRRYRARWSVKRSYKKASGSLQPQEITLREIDTGEAFGGKKTETLQEIEQRVGLDFDQFRRSVLLAQGDFAAFLRAPPAERAKLLERVTGTDIYGRLSIEAHQRAKTQKEELARLEERRGGIALLAPEEREALAAGIAELEKGKCEAHAAREAARRAREWFERLAELERSEGEAAAAVGRAEKTLEEAAPRRLELAEAEAARPLAPLVQNRDEAVGALERTREDLASKEKALTAAEAAEKDARAALKQAEEQLNEARRTEEEARPFIEQARDLDVQIGTAAREAEAARKEAETAAGLTKEAEEEAERLERECAEGEARLAEVDEKLADAKDAEALAAAKVEEAREAYNTARYAAGEVSVEDLRAARDRLERRLAGLRELAALAEEAAVLNVDAKGALKAGEEEEAKAAEAGAEAARAAEALPPARAALEEARRALRVARSALDLEGRRAELREGEPCPLCGATEHPYAAGVAPGAGFPEEQERREAELEAEAAKLERARAAAEAARPTHEEAARKYAAQAAALRERLAGLAGKWTAARESLTAEEIPADPLDPTTREVVEKLTDPAKEEHSRILKEEERAAGLRRAEEEAREELEKQRVAFEETRQTREAAVDAVEKEREAQAERRRRAESARATFDNLSALSRKAGEELERRETALASLDEERGVLLGGCPVEEARAALDEALAKASGKLEADRKAVEEAAGAKNRAKALLEAARSQLIEKEEAARRAATALDEALAAHGLDLETLRRRLALGEEWIEERRRELEGLENDLRERRTILGERRDNREKHAGTERPEVSREAAEESFKKAETELEEIDRKLGEARLRLREDDLHRKDAEELGEEILRQSERTRVWAELDELIGAHDGKKFRDYAQGLTLRVLLFQANERLKDLAGRYRLTTVTGSDLGVQVLDREMGDEVRSVNTLSGGEGFLVSLSLALGLSELSARRTRVESLFIDEGFGSLDPETLETALSTLDALQATGRTVGLISHVPGLSERMGVRVRVLPRGGGRSIVRVEDQFSASDA